MVRKLLSIVALTLMVFGVQAQTLQMDPAANFHKTLIRRAPARVASLEGTTAYGYGTETDWQGLGVNASGVTFDVAIYVPAGAAFRNATINGINIPVLDTAMKDVSAWIRSDIYDDNDLAKATAAGPFKANEYFSVAFDEPVPVPEEGFYAGYTFTCSINYPVAMGAVYAENGILLQYTNNGQASGWGDYSSQFPASPLQVFISGISLPDYSISLSYVGQSTQLTNSTYSIPVDVVSSSAKAIENVDVAVTVEGKTEQKHITLAEPIETGLNKSASFIIEGTSPAEPGRYEANIVIKKVNGTEYEEPATGVGLLKNLTKKVKRNTVIEEFTGTGCGWCPRGWAGMEYMKENYPDNFIGIAFHKYNSTDPMYYANYPYLGLTGAPGCIVDRKIDTDPYYGHVDNDLGIAETFGILNSELPEVDVKAVSHWEQDGGCSGQRFARICAHCRQPFWFSHLVEADQLLCAILGIRCRQCSGYHRLLQGWQIWFKPRKVGVQRRGHQQQLRCQQQQPGPEHQRRRRHEGRQHLSGRIHPLDAHEGFTESCHQVGSGICQRAGCRRHDW